MNKITPTRTPAAFPSREGLADAIADRGFRASFVAHSLRGFLADQIRALRGDLSQKAFGQRIGKPQSVVSRLENEDYGRVSLQTLIDIAEKLDIAVVVRFTDFPTFLGMTEDFSDTAVAPLPFEKQRLDDPATAQPRGRASSAR